MNDNQRAELARIRERQAQLEAEFKALSQQLRLLEIDLSGSEPEGTAAPPSYVRAEPAPTRTPTETWEAPPVISQFEAQAATPSQPPPTPAPVTPPPVSELVITNCLACGAELRMPARSVGTTMMCPHCARPTKITATQEAEAAAETEAAAEPAVPVARVPERPAVASPPSRLAQSAAPVPASTPSLEMRVGTYWLVRVGVVMLLTGLVFFGNYAYQKVIVNLGPGGKVSLMYLAGALLLGVGAWLQRGGAKETLRNYAQVLFAGGLATVYFTTYAAHHLDPLRVIQSAALDGALLLAWAGFIAWIADRKKSELLGFFSVGLAYYSSVMTRVGYFTLYSNLVLAAAAVFFLVRNRWTALSFGSLIATYVAYGFWRFFDGSQWHWATPEQGLWSGAFFLISYWVIFTAAVFLAREERFAGANRSSFLTLNNGAFFTLFLLTMLQVQPGGFWKFALIYGGALLALCLVAAVVLRSEPFTRDAYLTQGLLLVTVGIISKFAGLQLALMLGAESVILLLLGQQRGNVILLAGAYLTGLLSVGWGIDGMRSMEPTGMYAGIGIGALMFVNAVLTHLQHRDSELELRPQPTCFTLFALVTWLVTIWNNTRREEFPLVLAVAGILLTASVYLVRAREIALFAQGFLVLAQAAAVFSLADALPPMSGWTTVAVIAITLGASHWWERQKVLRFPAQGLMVVQAVYGVAVVALLYFWLGHKADPQAWIAWTALLAVGVTAYGVYTRAWFVALFAQLFLLASGGQFAWQLSEGHPPGHFTVIPIFAAAALSFGTVVWFKRRPGADARVREPLLNVALIYRWIAMAMSIWWVCEYVSARERIWLLALLGAWFFVWAGWRISQEALALSACYTLTALALFWLPLVQMPTVYWPNLVVIVLLLGQRQMARRLPERYPVDPAVHTLVILAGGASLWLFLSRWVMEIGTGFYLTASWSGLALVFFFVGIWLRERMYRWLGLGVLACALGRVVVIDVWKLETLYRVLSFFALGIALLVLGFIYNKYQEKIREWL